MTALTNSHLLNSPEISSFYSFSGLVNYVFEIQGTPVAILAGLHVYKNY